MNRLEAFGYIAAQAARGDISFPTSVNAVLRLQQALNDPDCHLEEAIRLVLGEPQLAARTVALANSSAFNAGNQPITNVRAAVTRVGYRNLQMLVASLVVRQFGNCIQDPVLRGKAEQLWEHTVQVAGGNVTLSNYAVNAKNKDAFGAKDIAVAAGGNLKLSNGSINNGVVYAGGTTSISSAPAVNSAASSPVDFKALESYYKTLAKNLTELDPTGTVAPLWSGVKITGSGNGGVDVFNVSADMFATSSSWTLDKLTPGETLIFNISGKSGTFNNGGISFGPLEGYNVLFNFYEATSLNVKGVIGSVLAPYATVSENWGVINGNVIVDTWASTVQVNANHYFTAVDVKGFNDGSKPVIDLPTIPSTGGGNLPIEAPSNVQTGDVPEPGSMALLLAGAVAAAALHRSRKRAASAASA